MKEDQGMADLRNRMIKTVAITNSDRIRSIVQKICNFSRLDPAQIKCSIDIQQFSS